jgi:type II secretory pathway predicted ATPase ExeA
MMRAPWATHFGFTKLPFSKNVSAKDLLDRASHQEAVARIRFCIAESLLGVITGEVGVGKTVAVRAAISQLDPAAHHIVYLANPTVGTRGLYVTIVRALGAMPRGFKAELVAQTYTLLATEEQERRRRVVLVIDEAHLLTPEQLEAIRLLTNADMDSAASCSLLLVGQPTLARQLRLGVFAAYVTTPIMSPYIEEADGRGENRVRLRNIIRGGPGRRVARPRRGSGRLARWAATCAQATAL